MKKKVLLWTTMLLLCMVHVIGQTTLSPGDLVFVALNSDEPAYGARDDISFLLLVNIESGTIINFTPAGWDDSGAFTPAVSDMHYAKWTASSALSAGTVVHIYENESVSNQMLTNKGSVTWVQADPFASWSISGAGDQVFAFQGGFDATASFIAGIHFNREVGTTTDANWDESNTSNTRSELPDGLTPGESAVWIWDPSQSTNTNRERDNMIYSGSVTSGSKEELQAAICNKDNWTTSRTDKYQQDPFPITFTVSGGCTEPTVPTVTATSNPICESSTTTLNISGTLNDATAWHIYTGSCGGTELGSTSTSSFDVTPSTSTTYYVRGEGGCVTPALCGSITITVNTPDDASFSYGSSSYCADASDPTPTITGLTGGSFSSSPTGLSISSSTGEIDVSASTAGEYTVTYTTVGTCPNSSDVSVTINALDDASFSYSSPSYCADASDPTPTITGLTGGYFSSSVAGSAIIVPTGLSINSSTGEIDVSASTPGEYTVTYTTAGTCPNSSDVNVTINALDDASFGYDSSSYCADASDPTPTITGLTGGYFSSSVAGSAIIVPTGLSINSSTGEIDVSASTPGEYTVTYTTVGTCPNSSDVNVTINALDDASFSYDGSNYTIDGIDPIPTISGLAGGSFSCTPTGLSINSSTGEIDLSACTADTYSVVYTTTGTCPNTSDQTLTISLSTGSTNELKGKIKVYPNPSKGIFKVSVDGVIKKITVKVYDATGNVILMDEAKESSNYLNAMDISNYPKGVYYFKIIVDDQPSTFKVLVQ